MEDFFRKSLEHDYLRIFGAVGFTKKKQPKFDKFEAHGKKVVLLSYATNSKEYSVKDYYTNQVLKVKNIAFNVAEKYDNNQPTKHRKFQKKSREITSTEDTLVDYWLDLDDSPVNEESKEKENIETEAIEENEAQNLADSSTQNIITGNRTRRATRRHGCTLTRKFQQKLVYAVPQSFNEAMKHRPKEKWLESYNAEISSLEAMGKMKFINRD